MLKSLISGIELFLAFNLLKKASKKHSAEAASKWGRAYPPFNEVWMGFG